MFNSKNQNQRNPSLQLMIEYRNYLDEKRHLQGKMVCNYNGIKVGFTPKQAEILKLVAQGFSNIKIAKKLEARESTIKLSIYRLMKYLEHRLYENIDRFYLIIIAQQFDFEE